MRYEVYSIDENGNETLFGEYDDTLEAALAAMSINGKVKGEPVE
jgi:hypothetical protein